MVEAQRGRLGWKKGIAAGLRHLLRPPLGGIDRCDFKTVSTRISLIGYDISLIDLMIPVSTLGSMRGAGWNKERLQKVPYAYPRS